MPFGTENFSQDLGVEGEVYEGYAPGSTHIAGWNMDPLIEDVFPIEHEDIPASYVSLPEGYVSHF